MGFDFLHRAGGIKPDDLGKFEKLNDINTALATLDPGNKGLMLLEFFRELLLAQAGLFPLCNK